MAKRNGGCEAQRACRRLSAARPPIPGQQLSDAINRVIGDASEHVAQVTLGIDTVHLGGLSEGVHGGSERRRNRSQQTDSPFVSWQSRGHSAYIGQDVVVRYRWHPLHGQRVRRIQSERRASGELVHVELTPGAVTILPAWKLDAIYCAGLKVGAPQVALAALRTLREVLIACESRLVSADGNIVTQEAQDGSAVTTRTKEGACLQTHSPDGTTPARSRSRRRATSGHDTGGAPSRAESDGAAPARGGRRSNAGGQR